MKRKATQKIELVETHNLSLSIQRLRDLRPYDSGAWKRAVYHALTLNNVDHGVIKLIREALELP